jgi:MoaA/NifB/PqqE/SkfB family radical SAM enzyme
LEHVKEVFSSVRGYPQIQNEIITNGLLLDEEWIRLLIESNVRLTFSIDSPVKETYEYIRKGASFDELLKRLRLVVELEREYNKKIKRNITVVVMRSNYRHLEKFIDFVKEYSFENIFFNPVMHMDATENFLKDPDIDYGYLDAARDLIKGKLQEWDKNFYFVWNLPSTTDKTGSRQSASQGRNCAELFCTFPWKSIWISADREGLVTPDCWCHEPVGSILQNTLLEIWNSEMMQKYRRMISANDFSICNEKCVNGYTSIMNPKAF